jgi:hypothetical protein
VVTTEPRGQGRFTPAKLHTALVEVCRTAGLDATDAKLIRFTNNAVYRLDRHDVVVRIVGSRALRHRVGKVVRIAGWLAEHEVPAVRLLSGVEQPVKAGDHVATLWHTVRATGRRPTVRHLAELLKQVHALPRPPFELPVWAPLDDVRRRLGDAEELDDSDRLFLERRCCEVELRLAGLRFPLPPSVVHGDAHLGNLIYGPDGPVLCDFDSSGFGPPEWDLTPLPVGITRFGRSRRPYEEFARHYGFDVTRWEGYPVLRELRELKLTTSVLPILRSNPGVRPELHKRLTALRTGDMSIRWAPYR